jgi:hypothetical protein
MNRPSSTASTPTVVMGMGLLLAALLAHAAPAQASEVVKLARLVITGTRQSPEPATTTDKRQIQRLPPVLIEGRRSEDGLQLASQRRGLPKAL